MNNLKQEMMEHIKSLREEYDGRIDKLTQQNDVIGKKYDVISEQNDITRRENNAIMKENDVITKEIDGIRNENDMIRNDNDVIKKAIDVVTHDNDQLKAHLLTYQHQMDELKSHLHASDEQIKEYISDTKEVNAGHGTRIRQMEAIMRRQMSTKGHQQMEPHHNHTTYTHHTQGMCICRQDNKGY